MDDAGALLGNPQNTGKDWEEQVVVLAVLALQNHLWLRKCRPNGAVCGLGWQGGVMGKFCQEHLAYQPSGNFANSFLKEPEEAGSNHYYKEYGNQWTKEIQEPGAQGRSTKELAPGGLKSPMPASILSSIQPDWFYIVAAFFFEKETRDKCLPFSVSKSRALRFSRTTEAGEVSLL